MGPIDSSWDGKNIVWDMAKIIFNDIGWNQKGFIA